MLGKHVLPWNDSLTLVQRVRRERTPRERTPQRDTRTKNRTPPPAAAPAAASSNEDKGKNNKDDAGVHSGSEEGEIEED